MAILGDDGRGYELARKLESSGVWLAWLGEASHAGFVHSLASPAAWEAFMRPDDSKSRAQIQLQLRARALLFDKASISLFLRSPPASNVTSSSLAVAKLNPCCMYMWSSLPSTNSRMLIFSNGNLVCICVKVCSYTAMMSTSLWIVPLRIVLNSKMAMRGPPQCLLRFSIRISIFVLLL